MDNLLIEYAQQHTTPESDILSRLNRETHLTQVYPQMIAGHLQGALLRMISRMISPMRVLEIGTFTGYSTICLADGLSSRENERIYGVLHTMEINPEREPIIRKYLKESGLEDRIVLHIGDAMELIPKLKITWDLVYLDADKPNYLKYYQNVIPWVRKGGYILADNVLWGGKVLDTPEKRDKDTRAIAEFNRFVLQDNSVENLLLPFRDGVMVIRKKE